MQMLTNIWGAKLM